MKRVFAYFRVSTSAQFDKGGRERQESTIRDYCTANKCMIARVFDDRQSGADDLADRKMLLEMLELAGPGLDVDTIVVERADRIARDLIHQEVFFSKCKERGVKVISADSGMELVLTDADPTRVLMRQILGALAQWERTMINAKLLAGRKRKKMLTGKPCGGPAPYTNPEAVKLILHLRTEGFSLNAIVLELARRQIPAPRGDKWYCSMVVRILQRQKGAAL